VDPLSRRSRCELFEGSPLHERCSGCISKLFDLGVTGKRRAGLHRAAVYVRYKQSVQRWYRRSVYLQPRVDGVRDCSLVQSEPRRQMLTRHMYAYCVRMLIIEPTGLRKDGPTFELTRRGKSKHAPAQQLVKKHARAARVQRFVMRPGLWIAPVDLRMLDPLVRMSIP